MARILLIDDEADFRNMLIRILERPGVELMEAANGDRGLQLINQTPVDLVITDILMPEKDGIELIQNLRRQASAVKIIAISGGGRSGRTNYLQEAEEFGADAVLAKPFGADALRNIVASMLPGYVSGAMSNA